MLFLDAKYFLRKNHCMQIHLFTMLLTTIGIISTAKPMLAMKVFSPVLTQRKTISPLEQKIYPRINFTYQNLLNYINFHLPADLPRITDGDLPGEKIRLHAHLTNQLTLLPTATITTSLYFILRRRTLPTYDLPEEDEMFQSRLLLLFENAINSTSFETPERATKKLASTDTDGSGSSTGYSGDDEDNSLSDGDKTPPSARPGTPHPISRRTLTIGRVYAEYDSYLDEDDCAAEEHVAE